LLGRIRLRDCHMIHLRSCDRMLSGMKYVRANPRVTRSHVRIMRVRVRLGDGVRDRLHRYTVPRICAYALFGFCNDRMNVRVRSYVSHYAYVRRDAYVGRGAYVRRDPDMRRPPAAPRGRNRRFRVHDGAQREDRALFPPCHAT
jgi:hypothetical protein